MTANQAKSVLDAVGIVVCLSANQDTGDLIRDRSNCNR
jgi:hypothetical protein